MKALRWNPFKNEWLRLTRGVTFNDLIQQGIFLGTRHHPTRSHQQILLFKYGDHIWVVPYVKEGNRIFLKTLYPSRKHTKLYKRGALR